MNIALVFPKSTFLTNPMVWPPLGLWYLGAQLEAQNHKTEFFDLSFRDMPEDGEFDQLWLSATSAQMFEVRKIAEITKNWKTRTVFGGSAPWADPESCKGLFDLMVVGEGDHPDVVRTIVEDAGYEKHDIYTPRISRNLDWVLPPIRRWSLDYHSYMSDSEGNQYRMASL